MALNLGLNINQDTMIVTDAELLAANIELTNAEINFDRVMYQFQTVVSNEHDFNEIVTSLKKHASAECIEFAKDLIGDGVSLEAAESEEKKSLIKKVVDAFKRWWTAFYKFVKRCYYAIKDKIKSVIAKIPGLKDLNNYEFKTYFSTDTVRRLSRNLAAIANAAGDTEADRIKLYKNFVETPVDMSLFSPAKTGTVTLESDKAVTEWLSAANELSANFVKALSDPPDWAALVDSIKYEEHKAIREFERVATVIFRLVKRDQDQIIAKVAAHRKEAYDRQFVNKKTTYED